MNIHGREIDQNRQYDTDETAYFLGVRPATLAKWRCEGTNIPYTRIGRRIYYGGHDLISYIKSRRTDVAA